MTFFNYILFFPSFISGPINRYNSFAENISEPAISQTNYQDGIKRIISGLFKKIVLAANLLPYTIISLDQTGESLSFYQVLIGLYAYGLYVYFDFSGYTDMAIGCGKLVGINLPENFNYPYFKRNLQQFWANWHMSLTSWLTDYIYWPIAKRQRHIKSMKGKPIINSIICIITTFMVCGLWHGDGINFLLWGLYHGLGLAILNGYGHIVKKHYSKKWKKIIKKSHVVYGISNIVTFNYVSFGFLLFVFDMDTLYLFLQKIN